MKKVAILFGIDDYPEGQLYNAVNDATALSRKLQELGFETRCIANSNTETMHRELVSFKAILENATTGLFFFAGHGIQCKGENFLATIDTNWIDEISCKHTAFSLSEVIEIFEESGINTKILILDACRDNPFVKWRSVSGEGLAPVYAPKGTIIAFSTSPGQKASDGTNGHGAYTNALLMHIGTKKVSIEDMFKRVRNTVSSHTNHKQITWEHTSLMGTFFFNSGVDEGDTLAKYDDAALADRNYVFEDDGDLQNIVASLKTYNWYTQNPAIKRLNNATTKSADKNDLFVLGRNIYQTACGGSGTAMEWIESLDNRLALMSKAEATHILNGILFEIYFDCDGHLRKELKSDCYEVPVRLCTKEKYHMSRSFINSFLEQYPQRIIYMLGSEEKLNFDVVLGIEGRYYLSGIFFDGMMCIYDVNGTDQYERADSIFTMETTRARLAHLIGEKVAAPVNKLNITYNIEPKIDEVIEIPNRFLLLRYV